MPPARPRRIELADETKAPQSEAITVNRGELAAAFKTWDERFDPEDVGSNEPEAKAEYFFELLLEGKGRKAG
jgi:hypothetical protein